MWESILQSIVANLASNYMQSQFNRSDASFQKSLTDAPAQVADLKRAGLNPALAYGQISSAQVGSLGNYQHDFAGDAQKFELAKQQHAQTDYIEAQTDLLKAQRQFLIMKARNEAWMGQFDLEHQQERYDLEIQGKGLLNAGQDIQNQGYQLDNSNKIVQNDILKLQRDIEEFNKEMKSIDVKYHRDYVLAEVNRLISETYWTYTNANALKHRLPVELENLRVSTDKLKAEIKEIAPNAKSYRDLTLAQIKELRNSAAYKAALVDWEKYLKGPDGNWDRKFMLEYGLINHLFNSLFNPISSWQ